MDTPTKTCTKCGKELPATPEHFYKVNKSASKLRSSCRQCNNASNLEAAKKWRRNHPEQVKESTKRWRANNPEKYQAMRKRIGKRYNQKHADKIRDYTFNWRRAHPDKVRAQRERSRSSEQTKLLRRVNQRLRRARQKGAPGQFSAADLEQKRKSQNNKCYYCGETFHEKYTIEHVVPLSRGGTNLLDNIVLACTTCNLRKNNKLPHEWPEGGRLL